MKQPDIVHQERFLVMGTVTHRKPGTERPATFTAIWNEFERHHEKIRLHSVDSKYYGVSFAAAQDGSFDYLAGMAVGRVEEPPAGVEVREVPAATYAVFACFVQSIGQTYRYIFGEWQSTSGCEMDPTKCAFEEYAPGAETNSPALIHIPIRGKQMKSTPGQPNGAANGRLPFSAATNTTSSAAGSRR
jgi:predicted transcriptional regulator YdeE